MTILCRATVTWPAHLFLLLLLPSAASFSATPIHHNSISGRSTSLRVASLNQKQTESQRITASDELLGLLQQKASLGTKVDTELDNNINSLVKNLITTKTAFDPKESLNGPLFATVHFIGDTPLWEKIAVGNVRNVKGQRYTLVNETSGEFVNYAEIWGENLYLKAVGRFIEKGLVSTTSQTDAMESKGKNNPLELLTSFLPQQNKQFKPTPYDYEAIVSGASVVLFGKYSFDVTIEGTGTVRVLYADPNLRIFLSPTDTDVTRGAGDWESAGLIVVQVRNDLVYDDWNDQTL